MATADLGIVVLTADLTLYGFVVAYYAFSRGLHEQEKSRLQQKLMDPGTLWREDLRDILKGADRSWMAFYSRAALVDVLLVFCTLLVALSVGATMLLTELPNLDLFARVEVVLLTALFSVVAIWMGSVGYMNFRENFNSFGGYPGTPKSFWPRLRLLWRVARGRR